MFFTFFPLLIYIFLFCVCLFLYAFVFGFCLFICLFYFFFCCLISCSFFFFFFFFFFTFYLLFFIYLLWYSGVGVSSESSENRCHISPSPSYLMSGYPFVSVVIYAGCTCIYRFIKVTLNLLGWSQWERGAQKWGTPKFFTLVLKHDERLANHFCVVLYVCVLELIKPFLIIVIFRTFPKI